MHDPLRDGGGAGRDGHPAAVSGEVGVAGGVVAGPVAVPAGDDPELVVDTGARAEDADQWFQQGQVDDLPGAGLGVPVIQREHHRVGAGQAGDPVGEAERRQRRGSGFLPGLVGQAAHRLGEGAERAALRVRPGLPEAGDPEHHDGGVDLQQLIRSQAPFLQHPGAEVLDHHIGLGDQPAQNVLPLGFAEVQRDGPLVPGDHLPPQAVAVLVQAVGAGRVTAGVFDLDHVGAPVAEQHGGDRGRVDGAKVEDPQPRQGAVRWDGLGGRLAIGGCGGGRHARLVLLGSVERV